MRNAILHPHCHRKTGFHTQRASNRFRRDRRTSPGDPVETRSVFCTIPTWKNEWLFFYWTTVVLFESNETNVLHANAADFAGNVLGRPRRRNRMKHNGHWRQRYLSVSVVVVRPRTRTRDAGRGEVKCFENKIVWWSTGQCITLGVVVASEDEWKPEWSRTARKVERGRVRSGGDVVVTWCSNVSPQPPPPQRNRGKSIENKRV